MKHRNQNKIVIAAGAAFISAGLFIVGCGGNSGGLMQSMTGVIPGMGDSRTQRIIDVGSKAADRMELETPQRQDEIGQAVAIAVTNRYALSTDEKLNDYVNLVGLTIASVSPDPSLNYSFGVLETQDVAAYSAPGGYIFITRGALSMCKDESELAGVLAHEVAHVALNHGIELLKASKNTELAISAVKVNSNNAVAYGQFIDNAADTFLVKGFSRAQESQADAAAVKYLTAAGYDPAGLLRFLQRLQSATGSGGGVKQLMSTHPGTADRVAAVQREVGSNSKGEKLADRFAANVK